MGSASLDELWDMPRVRPARRAAAEDLKVRVIGAALLQSIGMFLLLYIGDRGGPDTDVRLGLTYAATHVAVGLAVLGVRPQVKSVVVFVSPGILLALVWAAGGGYWAGSWVLCLTAWAFISSRLSDRIPWSQKLGQACWLVTGVVVGGLFIALAVYVTNPLAYMLAITPGVLLLLHHYSRRPWRAALDCSAGSILLTLMITLPEYRLALEASGAGVSALWSLGLTWLTRTRNQ